VELTSREIAVLVWLGVFFLVAARQPSIRSSFLDVLRAAAHRQIVGLALLMAAYVAAEVWLLDALSLWTGAYLKETLLWFGFTALASGGRSVAGFQDPPYRATVLDGLKIMVVIEFVFGLVPFSLPVELLLVPSVGLLVLLIEVGRLRNDEASQQTVAFLTSIQALVGLAILGFGLRRAITDFALLADPSILVSFFLPPLLSLLFLPAMFLLVLYSRYQWLFAKVQGDSAYRRYARWQFIRRLGLRPQAVLEFRRRHAFALPAIHCRTDLDALLMGE
jgi:hypothetical protein